MKIFNASLLFIALASLVVGASAQGPGEGRMGGGMQGGMRRKPGEREKQMLAQLNLSPVQKKKTDGLIDEMVGKMMKMRPAGGGRPSPEAFKKFKEMRDEYQLKIDKVLTPAQLKKLEEMRKAQRAQFGKMRGPGGPGGPPKL